MSIDLNNKRIALLLSGGVDSSVALYELTRLGLRPDCFYIKIAPEDNPSTQEEWDCSSEEDIEMAIATARKYGCSLDIVDCHRDYWDRVTQYTIDKVKAGLTPNPDVMCNRLIKFGAFHEKRGHDYDLIATGHYAQTETDTMGRKWLTTSPDPVKDQTDFLAQIYDWQLQKALFPIGHYMKDEVRQIAQQEHLVNAKRKDSQGICFLGRINYNDYIRRYLGDNPGNVIEQETGRIIGQHSGLWFHTIGQRKGLGFGGGPWFVVRKDLEANVLYVSHGYDPATAYTQHFLVHDMHWLTAPIADVDDTHADGTLSCSGGSGSRSYPVTIKIRHTPDFLPADLEPLSDGHYMVHAHAPIHGVAPGQFCVIYDNRHHRCYGSGEILIHP